MPDPNSHLAPEPLVVKNPIFAFTDGLTFQDLADRSPELGDLLLSRTQEVRLPGEEQLFWAGYPDFLHLLAIVDEDGPETVALAPVLHCLVNASPRLDLRFVCAEDNRSAVGRLLQEADLDEDGDPELPLVLVLDEEWKVQAHWGPRPAALEEALEGWLAANPDLERLSEKSADEGLAPGEEERLNRLLWMLLHQMRLWYNSGMDRAAMAELRLLLGELLDEEVGADDGPA